jgi:GT2 family glycosyltransferase/glycosyltransferase involved in cell wall biosynthesis
MAAVAIGTRFRLKRGDYQGGFRVSGQQPRPEGAAERERILLGRLQGAEQARRDMVMGLNAFQSELERSLRVYRSQRAWKVMLFFRKAYALLVVPGWKAKMRFVRWLLNCRRPGWLDDYEPQFPDVLSYVPKEAHFSFLDSPLGTLPAASGTRPRNRYDLIVLPVFEFDFRFQRPQQLAKEFARQGHRVFWISPARVLPPDSSQAYEALPLSTRLWEVRLRAQAANIYVGQLDDDTVRTMSACVEQFAHDWDVEGACIAVQLPFWRRAALALREIAGARILYDCMDDWQAMPDLSEFNRSEERELVRECDVLAVTGRRLQETHSAASGREAILVRNAADFQFFSAAQSRECLSGIRRPIVGYFGAIAGWFDFDLLAEVARSRPQYSFVLIGGMALERDVLTPGISRLRSLPNVHLLGHRSYEEIPSYLAQFDACIIPFTLNELTRATDPVKLYEYLSQGKPVVATPMDELEHCRDLLYTAAGAGAFASSLDRAIEEDDPELRRRRMEFASTHTWPDRYRTLDDAVRKAFPLVSVIVVTYNSAEFVRPCLDSLASFTSYPNYEVLVVDNDSKDATAALLESYAAADPRIQVILNDQNSGFAAANNLGARKARGDYLVLLNPDTMVTSGWIERLLAHCRRDPLIGMIVPVTNWAGNEARINVPYSNSEEMERFAQELARRNRGTSRDLTMAPLFCALLPRAVWEKAGGLDERFEVGLFEDDDLSVSVTRLGYRIVAAEDCFVHHFGQGVFSKLARATYERVLERNRRRFEEKWGVCWSQHRHRSGVAPGRAGAGPAEFVKARGCGA